MQRLLPRNGSGSSETIQPVRLPRPDKAFKPAHVVGTSSFNFSADDPVLVTADSPLFFIDPAWISVSSSKSKTDAVSAAITFVTTNLLTML